MISDISHVSMSDGTQVRAVDVMVGRELLAHQGGKIVKGQVQDKTIQGRSDVIGLVLNSGKKLCGSRDQEVAVVRTRATRFVALEDVRIGDKLRGEVAGMPVVVTVIGLVYYPRTEIRLVGLTLDRGKDFVAEGVWCR